MRSKKIIFFILILIVGASCAPMSVLQPEHKSLIDIKYRLNLMKLGSHNIGEEKLTTQSSSLSFYQSFLSPVLSSHCIHYPTDSKYAKILFSQCSWPVAVVKTVSRYLSEADAQMLYPYLTIEKNQNYFVDLPEGCSL